MKTEPSERDVQVNRLRIAIFYEGPWERFMNWLWRCGPRQQHREVRDGSIRDRLACLAEARHRHWMRRYEDDPSRIHPRWKRRPRRGD